MCGRCHVSSSCFGFGALQLSGIRANPVIPCGLGYIGPNENVRDLSGGDCDAPKSDKCMCVEFHIGYILGRTGSSNCNLTSLFGV